MTLLSRLVRQSGVYALGNAAVKVAGVALAPLLLNPAYLTVEAFGSFALLMVSAQLGIFVVGLGLGTGLLRFLSGDAGEIDTESLPFTALAATLAAAGVAAAVLALAARPLAGLLAGDAGGTELILLVALYVGFKVVASVPLTVLRVEERAGTYVAAVVAELAVLVGTAWYLMVREGAGLEGLMTAYAGAAGASALVLTGALLRRIRWRFDPAAVRPLLRYGIPLVLASLAGWFLNAGDRYLLKWLADTRAVAGYEWSARLAGVVNMLFVQSFQLAFTVLGMKALGAQDASFYRRTMRHYVIWTGWAVLGLGLFTGDGMRLLMRWFDVDAHYAMAGTLVFPLALGFMGFGVYVIVNNVLLAAGRTRIVGVTVAGAAVLNAALNIVLIPVWGAMGAAVATAVSYGVLALASARAAGRQLPIDYPWRVPVVVLVLMIGLYAAGLGVESWSTVPRVSARVALWLAYAAAIPAAGLYRLRDLREAAATVRARFRA